MDWERQRFLVHSPKNEHLEDGGDRWVPMFPELRPYLDAAYERAADGAVHVINRYRSGDANLRTQFMRIIKKAGVLLWPRLFHNLRGSRQTELAAKFPIHVVCSWIGNTELVAAEHYLHVTDEDFDQAVTGEAGGVCRAQCRTQTPATSARVGARNKKTPEKPGFSGVQSHGDAAGLPPRGRQPTSENRDESHIPAKAVQCSEPALPDLLAAVGELTREFREMRQAMLFEDAETPKPPKRVARSKRPAQKEARSKGA